MVYPAHGVGQILAIEEQEIAGAKLELFVINFMKDKMTLRVPTAKVANVGMRKLSSRRWSRRRWRRSRAVRALDHVVAPGAGIRSEDQFGRHRRDRRSGPRLYRSESQPNSPTANASFMKQRSIGCRARSPSSSIRRETEAVKEIEPARQEPAPRRKAEARATAKRWCRNRNRRRRRCRGG